VFNHFNDFCKLGAEDTATSLTDAAAAQKEVLDTVLDSIAEVKATGKATDKAVDNINATLSEAIAEAVEASEANVRDRGVPACMHTGLF
jgi:hypothetical protein